MMWNREKDPQHCRDLRRIDRTIRDELNQNSQNSDRIWRTIESLRSQINRLREESESVQRQLVAGVAASVMRGPGGAALGASLIKLEVQYELLRQEIERLHGQLQHLENDEQRLRRNHDRLQAALQENADRMKVLNCVI